MRVQIASDLHLEVLRPSPADTGFESVLTPGVAPTLLLAGDIGRPGSAVLRAFLSWCATHWATVVLVPGNHELWAPNEADKWKYAQSPPPTAERRIAALRDDAAAAGPHVHVLERDALTLPDDTDGTDGTDGSSGSVTVLGATLWTPRPIDAAVAAEVAHTVNDYVRIPVDATVCDDLTTLSPTPPVRAITLSDTDAWHARDVAWLTTTLAALAAGRPASGNHRVVVMTHHIPLKTDDLVPLPFRGAALNAAFMSDVAPALEAAPGGDAIVAWLAGHSHVAARSTTPRGTPVVVNARGYRSQGERVPGWDAAFVMDV